MKQAIRAIIVDDEPLAREGVRLHLEDTPDIEVIGEAGTGEEALELIESLHPDLLFLDVQMPGALGTDVLRRIEHRPFVIFTTAYSQHGVAGAIGQPSSVDAIERLSGAFGGGPITRLTGIVPVPTKNILISQPLIPLPVKYSALATKVTFRFTISGMKIESENERWLLAMIAGPESGTLSRPSTCGRKISLSHGPRMMYFISQYSTVVLPETSRFPRFRRTLRHGTRQVRPGRQAGSRRELSTMSLRSRNSTPQRTPVAGR